MTILSVSSPKYFGTDGIRGRVGKFPIVPEFFLELGKAIGHVLGQQGASTCLVGKDTRVSGYMMESALEAGLSSVGMDVVLLGPMPTPAVAHFLATMPDCVGIVISASHNPYDDNGIKIFGSGGTKLSDRTERLIEEALVHPIPMKHERLGKASRMPDASDRYVQFCKQQLSPDTTFRNLRIVIDCAHGATYRLAPRIFTELGATVLPIGITPDGLNINLGCGAAHPQYLADAVRTAHADLGVTLDGDGDRVMLADESGSILDGDDILYLFATAESHQLGGALVGTTMNNYGLEQALKEIDLIFFRSAVGDRYIMEMLLEKGLFLGGETSGHIIDRRKATTADGIITAMRAIEIMLRRNCPLSTMTLGERKYPQAMINVALPEHYKRSEVTDRWLSDLQKKTESEINGCLGRVLLRPSGTEPVLRVMVEMEDIKEARILAGSLADAAKRYLAALEPSIQGA